MCLVTYSHTQESAPIHCPVLMHISSAVAGLKHTFQSGNGLWQDIAAQTLSIDFTSYETNLSHWGYISNVTVIAFSDELSVYMWQRKLTYRETVMCRFNQSQKLAYGWLQV